HCLYFADADRERGHVYVQGWAFAEADATAEIEVTSRGRSLARIPADLERADVAAAVAGAPVHCGFAAHIPVDDAGCLNSPVKIQYVSLGQKHLLGERSLFDIDDLFDAVEAQISLSRLQQNKLRNLIQNEKERVNHVSDVKSKPPYLIIDPSWGCQLRCPFCHGNMVRAAGFSLPMLNERTVDKVLDLYGETLVQAHFFNWGEPLLNRHFACFVKKARAYEAWTTTSTNFSLEISEERLDEIIQSGLDLMIVSVDGTTQQTYEKYRRGGKLDLVLGNLCALMARKRALRSLTPEVRFQFLDFPWTHHQLDEARALAADIGVDVFHIKAGCIHPLKRRLNLQKRSGAAL